MYAHSGFDKKLPTLSGYPEYHNNDYNQNSLLKLY